MSIEFPELLPVVGRACPHCNTPLRNTYIEHIFGWGDIERLECAVKDTPVLQCGCGTSIEGHVLQRIKEKSHLVLRAIESEDESAFGLLTSFLDEEDISKVRDFTFNRRVPYPRSRPHPPTPALTKR